METQRVEYMQRYKSKELSKQRTESQRVKQTVKYRDRQLQRKINYKQSDGKTGVRVFKQHRVGRKRQRIQKTEKHTHTHNHKERKRGERQ